MNARYERRSTEAPMDFEFTNKNRNVIGEDSPFRTPVKPPFTKFATVSSPAFSQSQSPFPCQAAPVSFGRPPVPTSPWSPRPPFSATEIEIQDVSMEDASPSRLDSSPVALEKRPEAESPSKPSKSRQQRRDSPSDEEEADQSGDEDEEAGDEVGALTTIPRRRRPFKKSLSEPLTTTMHHNHHYTFNVPKPQLAHSEIPYLLLGYLQFFFNLSLVIGLLYLAYGFFRNVQKDVEHKMLEHKLDIIQDITMCTRLYTENFCGDRPSPAILDDCEEWRRCMSKDANIVKRTKLLAELIGETIDSFMEPISWRTMIFSLASLTTGIILINSLLMFYRARHAPSEFASPPAPAPLFHSNSLPYWPPPSQAIASESFTQGHDRRALSVPPGEDHLPKTPSRRRKPSQDNLRKDQ